MFIADTKRVEIILIDDIRKDLEERYNSKYGYLSECNLFKLAELFKIIINGLSRITNTFY